MLYTIDHINRAEGDFAILPKGVRVGAHVLDDCDTDTYGLEQAVDFIKGRDFIKFKQIALDCRLYEFGIDRYRQKNEASERKLAVELASSRRRIPTACVGRMG